MHNARIKTHADGTSEVLIASTAIFREPGWEERKEGGNRIRDQQGPEGQTDGPQPGPLVDVVEMSVWDIERGEELARKRDSDALARAKRRVRTNVRDYALNTDFRYFVTLTLDQARIDRYDVKAVTRALNVWCDNQVRRKGLAYVLVAEEHKDGAIHFHGFFNGALPVADSGTMVPPGGGKPRRPRSKAQAAAWAAEGGHKVYNLPAWTLGYTTAIELYGDRYAAVGYVCKYITKAQNKIGGRWYYSGGELGRPDVLFADLDMEQAAAGREAHSFETDSLAGVKFVTFKVEGGGQGDVLRH